MSKIDCLAVDLWRRQFKLNLSASWKADVEKTVKDLSLWKKVLEKWKREKRHPGIKGILDEYERKSMETADSRYSYGAVVSARRGEGLSTGSDSEVSKVRMEPPSLYFRTR